jgi:hypothetical protein
MNDWVLAYSTNKLYKAEMIKSILEENNFNVVLVNKQDSFYLFGNIELYVSSEDLEKAKVVIQNI